MIKSNSFSLFPVVCFILQTLLSGSLAFVGILIKLTAVPATAVGWIVESRVERGYQAGAVNIDKYQPIL